MPGDAALRLLIDIQARDRARGAIAGLVGGFFGLSGIMKSVNAAFKSFAEASDLRRMAGLAAAAGHTSAALFNMGLAAQKSQAGMRQLGNAAGQLLISFVKLLAILTLVAAAVAIALGVAAVKAAGDFQQQMLKVYALTGMSKAEFDKMNASILAMAPAVATGPVELAKALYYVESDGFKGAAALKLVELSAIAAKIGLAAVMTVAFALTSAIRAFGFADSQATYVMNIMNNTVRQGKMEWQAYATQVGRLSTAAKTAGYSFIEANAALATLTQGGNSAFKSTTYLINLFNQLNLKTDAIAKHAKAAGIAFDEQKFKAMSLGEQIAYLTKITHGNSSEIMKLFGNNSIATRGYQLLAQNAGIYKTILDNLNKSQQRGNTLMDSWNKTQTGFNVQLDKGKAAFQVLLIVLGNRLLPILTQILTWLMPIITAFTQWVTKTDPLGKAMAWLATAFDKVRVAAIAVWNFLVPIGQFILATLTPVFQLVGKVITNILIPAWNDFIKAIQPWLPDLLIVAEVLGVILVAAIITVVGVFLLIIGAVLLVIGIFLALVAAILYAANWVRDKINWLVNQVVGFFKWLWNMLFGGSIIPDIVNAFISWFTKLRAFIIQIINYIVNWIVAQWTKLKAEAEVLWAALVFIVQSKLNQIKQAVLNIIGQAVAWGVSLVNNILSGIQSAWASLMNWVNGALNSLKNLFPHSPVKEGPLKGYENWGYTFGMGIADGIRRSIPAVKSASNMLAAAVGGGYSGSYSLSGSSSGGGYPTGGAAVVVNHIVIMPPDVKLDGASVVEKIGRRQAKEIRIQGGIRNR